jgi:hypothetical protein
MSASAECLPGPIEALSDDLLRLIFLFHLDTYAQDQLSTYDWINLAQVCKRWNLVIFTTSSFFADITMHGRGASATRLARLLDLSGTAPLSVYLPPHHVLQETSLLAPHMGRVRKLHITVRGELVQHQRALAHLFSGGVMNQLLTLQMDVCPNESESEYCLNIGPVLPRSIPRLQDLSWTGAVDWTSPVLEADLRGLAMLSCDHVASSVSLQTVQRTIRHMPLLETLRISHRHGFSCDGPSVYGHGLDITLPRLKFLELEMPARAIVLLSNFIRAPALAKFFFATILGPDLRGEATLNAIGRALRSYVETTSSSVVHLGIEGMIGRRTAGTSYLTFETYSTGLVSQARLLPRSRYHRHLHSLRASITLDGRQLPSGLELPQIMTIWDHLHLEALTVSYVSISALTWCRALRNQPQIAALDAGTYSIVSLLDALRQDVAFLPRLSYLLIRDDAPRYRETHWLSEGLMSDLTLTFARSRKLTELWLQDDRTWSITAEHLKCLENCASRVMAFQI